MIQGTADRDIPIVGLRALALDAADRHDASDPERILLSVLDDRQTNNRQPPWTVGVLRTASPQLNAEDSGVASRAGMSDTTYGVLI
ncbi:MAG TPA: hypothetical protein VJX67_11585 [Blastocatellia bacterium]|nr:hypothetical protein [Blastocatellia bacterium]